MLMRRGPVKWIWWVYSWMAISPNECASTEMEARSVKMVSGAVTPNTNVRFSMFHSNEALNFATKK